MKLPLYAPKGFWDKKEKGLMNQDCNGCGSELDVSGKLVPDTIYGLDIRDSCCCPHDYMYKYGLTRIDKIFADVMFLYNMIATILNYGGWLTMLRIFRATKYFVAVVQFGDESFSFEKEIINENRITFQGSFI
jgi:hypothetical protein